MALKTCGRSYDSVMERVLQMNIQSSEYYKELSSVKSHLEVIDEIYNQVEHVEPWMSGNARGSSTAFCLLYKLFTLELTIKQVQDLLTHEDSPYIRAVGFLYLRYIADPKTLWDWFEPYLEDDEEFSPGTSGKMVTMGLYIRDLLLELYYFDTIFPRIPVPVARQITANLESRGLPTKGLGSGGTGLKTGRGADEGSRRPPSVKAALSVAFGQRAPHRSGAREAAAADRPRGSSARLEDWDEEPPPKVRDRSRDTREKDKSPLAVIERERAASRDGRERSKERTRERSQERREERSTERRDRSRDRRKERSRERRDRDRRDGRERERSRDRKVRKEGGSRDRSRDRKSERNRDEKRDRSRNRERGIEREKDEKRDRSRDRERGKERERDRSRDRKDRREKERRDRSREREGERHRERSKERRKEEEGRDRRDRPKHDREHRDNEDRERARKDPDRKRDDATEHEHKRRKKDEEAVAKKEGESKEERNGQEDSLLIDSKDLEAGKDEESEEGEIQGDKSEAPDDKVLPTDAGLSKVSEKLVSECPDLAGQTATTDIVDGESK